MVKLAFGTKIWTIIVKLGNLKIRSLTVLMLSVVIFVPTCWASNKTINVVIIAVDTINKQIVVPGKKGVDLFLEYDTNTFFISCASATLNNNTEVKITYDDATNLIFSVRAIDKYVDSLIVNAFTGIQFTQDKDDFSKSFPFIRIDTESLIKGSWKIYGSFALTSQKTCTELESDVQCTSLNANKFLSAQKALEFRLGVGWELFNEEYLNGHELLMLGWIGADGIDYSTNDMHKKTFLGFRLERPRGKFRGAYYQFGYGKTDSLTHFSRIDDKGTLTTTDDEVIRATDDTAEDRWKFEGYLPFFGGSEGNFDFGVMFQADMDMGRYEDVSRVMVLYRWDVRKFFKSPFR